MNPSKQDSCLSSMRLPRDHVEDTTSVLESPGKDTTLGIVHTRTNRVVSIVEQNARIFPLSMCFKESSIVSYKMVIERTLNHNESLLRRFPIAKRIVSMSISFRFENRCKACTFRRLRLTTRHGSIERARFFRRFASHETTIAVDERCISFGKESVAFASHAHSFMQTHHFRPRAMYLFEARGPRRKTSLHR